MPELATILEREARSVDLEPGDYDRLLRRHGRRRRNRRIGSALLALAITAATVGYAVGILHGRAERVPMDRITSRNVGRLGLAWSTEVIISSGQGSPTVRDGIVYAGVGSNGSGGVQGFPAACLATDGSCRSNWSTSRPIEKNHQTIALDHGAMLVGEGSVYVSASVPSVVPGINTSRIEAYPRSCGGDRCRPTWVSRTVSDPQGTVTPLAEEGGRLYAFLSDRLLAYPPECGRSVCDPIWTAKGVGPPTLADGRAVVRTGSGIEAFSSACWISRGPTCHAIWTASIDVRVTPTRLPPPVVADGRVLIDAAHHVLAFPLDCRGACSPEWRASIPGGPGFEPVIAGGMMLTAARGGSDLYAFSIDCPGTGRGEICEPAWVGHADEGVGFPPLVAGGNVIVANTLGNTLTAFPVSCTGACAPVWSVPLEDSVTLAPVASGDLVFVPGLVSVTAFPSACPAPCGQVFRWDLPEGGPQASPLVDGDSLIVAGANTMYALRLGAAAPEAETSRSWAGPSAVFPLIVAGALFILIATVRRRRRAFP